MTLEVVSLGKIEFQESISSFTVKTKKGEITILNHHRPIVSELVSGNAKIILQNGEERILEITGGFLEVNDENKLIVLLSSKNKER